MMNNFLMETTLMFEWKTGSLNDNAEKVFKKNGITWEYRFQSLYADFTGMGIFHKVDFQKVNNDILKICFYSNKCYTKSGGSTI